MQNWFFDLGEQGFRLYQGSSLGEAFLKFQLDWPDLVCLIVQVQEMDPPLEGEI